MSEEISTAELDFLLRFPIKPHVTSPVDFLSNTSWGGICSLAAKDEFRYVVHPNYNVNFCSRYYLKLLMTSRPIQFSKVLNLGCQICTPLRKTEYLQQNLAALYL